MPTDEPTVFLVDDDAAVCDGLQTFLEANGLKTETFPSAEAFLAGYRPGCLGCLVLDVRMRGMSGLELQAKLVSEQLDIPIIIISGHGDIPTAVRAIQAGAIDFLEKPVNDQLLLDRIQEALRRALARRREREQQRELAERVARLTPRERLVMELVVAGKCSKEIAAYLGVTLKTVEAHRQRVFQKMLVAKAVELVRLVTAGRLPVSSPLDGSGATGEPAAG